MAVAILVGVYFAVRGSSPGKQLPPPVDLNAHYRKELQAGRTVTLVPKQGLPPSYRVIAGRAALAEAAESENAAAIDVMSNCLFELLDDPGVDRYAAPAGELPDGGNPLVPARRHRPLEPRRLALDFECNRGPQEVQRERIAQRNIRDFREVRVRQTDLSTSPPTVTDIIGWTPVTVNGNSWHANGIEFTPAACQYALQVEGFNGAQSQGRNSMMIKL